MSPIERSGGGGGTASPLTTKGDIYTFSTVNARLAVGSDTQVLTANSAATTGNDWEYPPGHQFDYVERTTNLSLSTGTETDWIVGNSVTYDGSTRVKLECWCGNADFSAAGGQVGVLIRLYDGVTLLNRIVDIRTNTNATLNAGDQVIYGATFFTPTAASHTYKVTAARAGTTTTVTLGASTFNNGDNNSPAWIRITKA